TLATQIEKFRHSPDGRTATPPEKLRQIAYTLGHAAGRVPPPARARRSDARPRRAQRIGASSGSGRFGA
ncbi:hypothetical protein PPH41_34935, partial [Burkholderia gladioli]|nr:hypothetical protein [Burkholderia gladioli]